MNCREKILSEDYMSILLDYVPEEANQEDEAFCYQQVDGTLGIYYLDRSAVLPLSPVNYLYRYLPQLFCLGAFPAAGSRTFRTEPLEGSGILAQQRPPLELTGRRVVMAFIDTGISYENPVFRYSDGSSRILAIWDQTDQSGQSPEGFLYGTEYVREQIDRALELEDPHSLVPEKDEIGHGTAVASVAAGSRLEEGSLFTGAAPDCEIVAVKLRPAKQYLRDYYRIADKEPAYSTDDILLAVKYVQQFVIPLYRPIVICLGLGTSFGSHSGVSLFSEYLQRIARSVSQAVVIGGGNEGNTAGHFRGRLTENQQQVELRVGEGVTGFTAELWGSKPSVFRLAVRSPGGEQLPEVEFGLGSTVEYTFVYEKTRIQITDTANERNTGDQLMLIRFTAPSPGVWTFLIRGARVFPESIFDIWLAPQQFRSGELFFLVPDPDVTLTVPSYTTDAVTVTFYNSENGSFYYRSGRGFGRTGEIKPDLAAPGVEISTVNGPYSGSSMAAALTAGACAQLMQWCVAENNYPRISGFSMSCVDNVIQTDILLRCDTVCQVRIPKKETAVCSVYPDRTGFPVPGPLCSRRFSHPLRLQDPWSCPNRTERPEDLYKPPLCGIYQSS